MAAYARRGDQFGLQIDLEIAHGMHEQCKYSGTGHVGSEYRHPQARCLHQGVAVAAVQQVQDRCEGVFGEQLLAT